MRDNSSLDMEVVNESDTDDVPADNHHSDSINSLPDSQPRPTDSPPDTGYPSTADALPDSINPGPVPVECMYSPVRSHSVVAVSCKTEMDQYDDTEPDLTMYNSEEAMTNKDIDANTAHNVGKFACTWCKRVFKKQSDLRRHERLHTGEMYMCAECPCEFQQSQSLLKHTRQCHTGEHPFPCGHCAEKFAMRHQLTAHIRKVHKNLAEIFQCKFCDVGCQSRKDLNEHVTEMHLTGSQKTLGMYTCKWCKRGFPYPSDLKRHQRVHTGEKPYRCEICQMSFPSGYERNRHVNKHRTPNGEISNTDPGTDPNTCSEYVKTFVCDRCGNLYFYKNDLNRHLRKKHKVNLPWMCSTCKFEFKQHDEYLKHKADVHFFVKKEKKPSLQCKHCGKMFKYASDLTRHELAHATTDFFKCELCEKLMKSEIALTVHIQEHVYPDQVIKGAVNGQDKVVCVICDRRFSRSYIPIHMKTHTVKYYMCRYCRERIQGREAMQKHRRQCDRRTPQCADCGKTFPSQSKLATHMLVHSGERKHTCDICQKSFKQREHLKGHKATHVTSICTVCGKEVTDVKRHIMRKHNKSGPRHSSNVNKGSSEDAAVECEINGTEVNVNEGSSEDAAVECAINGTEVNVNEVSSEDAAVECAINGTEVNVNEGSSEDAAVECAINGTEVNVNEGSSEDAAVECAINGTEV